jgi:hypothetical protein
MIAWFIHNLSICSPWGLKVVMNSYIYFYKLFSRAIIRYIKIPIRRNQMAGTGKADKGRHQQKKKPQHTLKEKRKLKEEKKKKNTGMGS